MPLRLNTLTNWVFLCVCPLNDNKLRPTIIKVAEEITSYKQVIYFHSKTLRWFLSGLKWREKTQKTAVNINFSQIDVNIDNSFSRFLIGYLTTVNKISLVKGFALWQLKLISARIKTVLLLMIRVSQWLHKKFRWLW